MRRSAHHLVSILFIVVCLGSVILLPRPGLASSESPTPAQIQGRARDLNVIPGVMDPGPRNAITDVSGVRVGHTTIWEGDDLRTGVTAILPHDGNMFRRQVPAAIVVGNGFGKLAGLSQVQELGTLETPILLTGTLSVPRVADALISYMLGLPGNENVRSVNPVVGETNDGGLSDIRRRPIKPEHVFAAIESAADGPVEEGPVGAGTGTSAFGFKGGIGTSSRIVSARGEEWTVGVLVQTNYGGRLTIVGVPVGEQLRSRRNQPARLGEDDGSCMIVVATDAPLDRHSLERLAFRALAGMARTGASFSNGSGDYVIAFSTHPALQTGPDAPQVSATRTLEAGRLSPLFQAVAEATEEAIYNSLFMGRTVQGFGGRRVEALPVEEVLEILERHGVLGNR